MSSWHKTTRSDWRIQDEFSQAWLLSGGPQGAGLFAVRNRSTRATDFYLTPAAAELFPDLVAKYGATECERPDTSTLAFLEGDQSTAEGSDY